MKSKLLSLTYLKAWLVAATSVALLSQPLLLERAQADPADFDSAADTGQLETGAPENAEPPFDQTSEVELEDSGSYEPEPQQPRDPTEIATEIHSTYPNRTCREPELTCEAAESALQERLEKLPYYEKRIDSNNRFSEEDQRILEDYENEIRLIADDPDLTRDQKLDQIDNFLAGRELAKGLRDTSFVPSALDQVMCVLDSCDQPSVNIEEIVARIELVHDLDEMPHESLTREEIGSKYLAKPTQPVTTLDSRSDTPKDAETFDESAALVIPPLSARSPDPAFEMSLHDWLVTQYEAAYDRGDVSDDDLRYTSLGIYPMLSPSEASKTP